MSIKKSIESNYVFAYGTLLAGERNHNYYLSNSTFIDRATLAGYDMYDISSFPGIVPGEGAVIGEVYEVSEETLEELDYLEGEGSLYLREEREVSLESGGQTFAYIYVYNHSIDGLERIPEWLQPYTADWEDKKIGYVWYASYGSNMLYERLMCYIKGGKFRGKGREHKKCSDTTEPRDSVIINLPYDMYFGNHSGRWNNGGVSFLDIANPGQAFGVAYLISKTQFDHICCEENSGNPPEVCPNWYNKKISIGTLDGYEIVTITNSGRRDIVEPSDEYLNVLEEGLQEHYPSMSKDDINHYLDMCKRSSSTIK